jgi:hypothetical protein
VAAGCGPGGLTPWWRGQGLGRATLGCGRHVAPLRLILGLYFGVYWNIIVGARQSGCERTLLIGLYSGVSEYHFAILPLLPSRRFYVSQASSFERRTMTCKGL